MAAPEVDALYDQATRRWPTVPWPRQGYAAHLGPDRPAHPIDLYVGGAAGHRIDQAWQVIDEDFGPIPAAS